MNTSKYPNRIRNDQYMLRLPNSLRERIKSHAKTNSRSMNTEMVRVLEAAFPAPAEPEKINDGLLHASKEILAGWKRILTMLGQNPSNNDALRALAEKLAKAERELQA